MTSFWYQGEHDHITTQKYPDNNDSQDNNENKNQDNNENKNQDNNETQDNKGNNDNYGDYDLDDYPNDDVPYENVAEYISSDDEQLDPNSIASVLECLKRNPIDDELVEDLVNLLETNGHYDLACQMARICLEISPNNANMIRTIKRIDRPNNVQLESKIRNLWMMKQTYFHNTNLLVKEIVDNKYQDPGTVNCKEVDLEGIVFYMNHIPSFHDTMIVIPSNTDYHVYRKFYVEQFQIYNLQIKFACSNNLDVSLTVNTETGDNRLNYKLSGSQIQYIFNTLGQHVIEIGLKGHNRPNQVGQIRLMDLSMSKVGFNHQVIDKNLSSRTLSPSLPIVANLYVTSADSLEGIRVTLDSIIYQVDVVNVYLNNLERSKLMEIDILLNNSKYRIKQGREGKLGSWHMSTEVIGYQFMIEAGILYDDNYVRLMLSKIMQYQNRVIVGLHGIQLMSDYENWSKSKKVISNIMISNQDIRCHLLGSSSMAFLSGIAGNILDMSNLYNRINSSQQEQGEIGDNEVPILFAIMAQHSRVGMVCVERTEKMLKYRYRDEAKMVDEIGSNGEQMIKSNNPWKYY